MEVNKVMKKFSILVFAIIMMSISTFAFSGGSGTQLDPYIVDTCADLQSLTGYVDAYAELGSDINCGGLPYTPYNFNGHLNGNGHTISELNYPIFNVLQSGGEIYNLTMLNGNINMGSTSYIGAISQQLQGQIRDIGVENYNIVTSADYTGGITGRTANTGAIIKNCYVNNTIIDGDDGVSDYIGGIVGHLQNSDYIYNSYTDLGNTITGYNYIGGIVGRNYGRIYNSYSKTNVNGNTYVGGFVGQNYGSSSSTARIYYSYSLGTATGVSNVHSFAGHNNAYSSNGQIYECYVDEDVTGDNSDYIASSISTQEMKDIRVFSGLGSWDFETEWLVDTSINNGYPEIRNFAPNYDNSADYEFVGGDGTVGTPYQISTCEAFMKIDDLNGLLSENYELVNNIDCSESEMESIGGTFSGIFDGNGYNITGTYVPLFDTVTGSIIDVNIIEANLFQSNPDNLGIVAKTLSTSGLIDNVFTNGIVTSINDNVGGLVGQISNGGTVTNSISYADILTHQGSSTNVGGLIGFIANGGEVYESFSHNNLVTGYLRVGGFVGRNDGRIFYSYTHSPDIQGYSEVGGFVGRNYGSSSSTARIYGSYSTGIPSGTSNVNSFVGYQYTYSSNGVLYDCYYDYSITGDNSGYGGDVIGLTTEQFTDIRYFSGEYTNYNYWNFDETWYFNNETGYPALQNLDNYDNSITEMVGDGSIGNPYQITECRQMWLIPDGSTSNYILMNDIDCSASEMRRPNSFAGVFDGNNNEIGYTYVPLFNVITTGTVRNLGVVNFENMLDLNDYMGVISEQLSGGLIEDVWTSGNIISNNQYLGGITGYLNTGTIRDARSYVNIIGSETTSNNVGGITGYVNNNGYIYTSSSYGNIQGYNQVGGITGYLRDGWLYDTFSQSNSIEGNSNVGGIVGYGYGSSSSYRAYVYRSYWNGVTLSGSSNVGGVVGTDTGSYMYIYDSYWNSESSGITVSSGGGATALTTSQMLLQSTYATSWDFVTTWFMDTEALGGYPNHQTTYAINPDDFNVYINYPENGEVIALNDSTDSITFQYLHDSNSTDITCKFYLDGVLYFTTYNTGNDIQEFTLSRWKDKTYYATLSCSDSFITNSVQSFFTVELENDLLTGNPNTNPDGGTTADINITEILDAINSLNLTVEDSGTVIEGDTSVYHNYYTGTQYLNEDAEEELNTSIIAVIDPRTNETINTSDKYVLDLTPAMSFLKLENGTLLSNLKPKNFYDNVLMEPVVTSEEANVEGFWGWLLDNVILNWVLFVVVYGGSIYAMYGLTFANKKEKWKRFKIKTTYVAILGTFILMVIKILLMFFILK